MNYFKEIGPKLLFSSRKIQEVGYLKPGEQHFLQSDSQLATEQQTSSAGHVD